MAMNRIEKGLSQDARIALLPAHRDLFYGGAWHAAQDGSAMDVIDPSRDVHLCRVAAAQHADVDAAVASARAAFTAWRRTAPMERADRLRAFAGALRCHGEELAALDSIDTGNPLAEMRRDIDSGARGIELFAGLVTETKGETIPMPDGHLNYTMREPLGVVARIIAFNHPILFATMRCAAPIAAGNTVVVKPADQAPLSVLRLCQILEEEDIFPAGVYNVVTGDRACGAALSSHPDVAKVSLIGSVPTGKAILRAAAETVKQVGLEMGGKNALIAYPDQDPDVIAAGALGGMNLTWAGQSCGSTSRVFLHASHHDAIVDKIVAGCAGYRPGEPTDPATTMGPLISRQQFDKVMAYIAAGKDQGARLLCGGVPSRAPGFENGFFIEPTVFADVTPDMKIAREEIFGPVLSIFRWSDEDALFDMVNDTDYGLTAAIFTRDLATAHKAAGRVEAGYVWVNHAGPHHIGAPFGGYKQSGMGREEGLEELLASTQIKNVNIKL
jgi:betaine-aldehyde dehydrogenase